ncbi:MAG: AAA family ATPase, partial [Rhodocyclaceae bacterium]|nr:AAA family ATPase [Rhodocyclaceae bacterium]
MYVQREAQKALACLMRQFKVVLVTGARQVGKSTMVQEVLADRFAYVSLDDARLRELARNDPALFMKDHVPPVVIDEAQKAPNLFDAVKLLVDARPDKGKIVLTGSQTYRLMHGVSETLAGRIAVLRLSGLSLRERLGLAGRAPYVPGKNEGTGTDKASFDVWTAIWRGDMPALLDPDIDWDDFYTHYTATYVERDVRELIQVANEERFYRFLISCAA